MKLRTALLKSVIGASVLIGGANSPVTASPVDPAPPVDAAAAARAPSCPFLRVCLWTGNNYSGTRGVFRPVASGECLEVADIGSGWNSAYNATFGFVRVWEFTHGSPSDGTRCAGDNQILTPLGKSGDRFWFGSAMGMGGY